MGWLEVVAGIILGGAALAGIIFLARIAFDTIRNRINRPIVSDAAIAGLAVITIALLTWGRIVDWFRERQSLKQSDRDNIAFTLQENLSNGNYKTVQGIFNKDTNECLDGVQYISEDIDEQVANVHRGQELVVYE